MSISKGVGSLLMSRLVSSCPPSCGGDGGMFKLSPVGAEQSDYWNQEFGDGDGLGINDFFPQGKA